MAAAVMGAMTLVGCSLGVPKVGDARGMLSDEEQGSVAEITLTNSRLFITAHDGREGVQMAGDPAGWSGGSWPAEFQ